MTAPYRGKCVKSTNTKKRGSSHSSWRNSEHFPSNRGIATTSVRTGLAMTENLEAKPLNNNLPDSIRNAAFKGMKGERYRFLQQYMGRCSRRIHKWIMM